jgi:hypothetical protein
VYTHPAKKATIEIRWMRATEGAAADLYIESTVARTVCSRVPQRKAIQMDNGNAMLIQYNVFSATRGRVVYEWLGPRTSRSPTSES